MKTSIEDLNGKYDLELESVIGKIKKNNFKMVLLQFAEGLRPYATSVVDFLEKETDSEFVIWLGSCFGACDVPVGLKNLKFDCVFQFGHNEKMPDF